MISRAPVLWLDFTDPISWVLHGEVVALAADGAATLPRRAALELRAPPEPFVDPDAPWWRLRWEAGMALAASRGAILVEPALVPWTRKAHELALHAAEKGAGDGVHEALFRAFLLEGRDIGRVDVLVDLAVAAGLDRTEAKAVLDVDRYADAVAASTREGRGLGLTEAPALTVGGAHLRGFHNRDRLRTFLCSS